MNFMGYLFYMTKRFGSLEGLLRNWKKHSSIQKIYIGIILAILEDESALTNLLKNIYYR